MAANVNIPKPPTEEIVNEKVLTVLSQAGLGLTRQTNGFGGTQNPSVIWDVMRRNLPEAFFYYRELEEKDDDIGGLLETLKLAVLGRPRSVKAADDSAEANTVADFIKEQLEAIPNFHGALHSLLNAPAYGFSIAEINYSITAKKITVDSINDCPPELFSFAPQRYLPQIGPLRFMQNIFQINGGEEVPEEKFLIFSYNMRDRNRFGSPMLRRAFWPSWFKRKALIFWLRFAEKGPGTVVVKYSGNTQDEKDKALLAAEEILNQVAVAIPENFQLEAELLTSARAQNPSVYEKLVQRNELAIARAILGETLTSHGSDQGAGSYALGQVHQEMFHQRAVELARALENIINDQLIKRLVYWNFGPSAPMPKWCIDTSLPDDLAVSIRIHEGLQNMGLPMTENFMRKFYSVPEPGPSDVILHPAASQLSPAFRPVNPGLPEDQNFSEEAVRKEVQEVQQLADQFKAQAMNVFTTRINQIAQKLSVSGSPKGGQQ